MLTEPGLCNKMAGSIPLHARENIMAGKLSSFIKGSLDKVKKALALPAAKSTDKKAAKGKAGDGKKKKAAGKEAAKPPKKAEKPAKPAAKKEKPEVPKKAAAAPAKPVAPAAASPAVAVPAPAEAGSAPAAAVEHGAQATPGADAAQPVHSALAGTAEAAHALLEKKKAKAAKPWYRNKQRW